ncbi:Tyrosine-protein phosphatase [Lachnellula suecica]|uniref:Tyrosine-protein phosphatase n=1 Tax=Lachnellula suecica TaxID=602035 RepID=A0A8T9BY20_9HELO|nr:Tyrosine-protein phosphatase [Lachnellula suecica]
MDRLRSSTKRAHSPSLSPVAQVDGACFGKPDGAEDVKVDGGSAGAGGVATPDKPKMPAFLMMSQDETREKYAELCRLESERLERGKAGLGEKWAHLDPDPVLDRYSNIFPWANNRIHLKVPEGFNDYINASPVTLVSTSTKQSTLKASIQDKYICMQGPKRQTVDHVWRMIWDEFATPYNSSPAVMIMLSPTHCPMPDDPSRIMEKCYTYFPKDENSEPIRLNTSNKLGENFHGTVKFVSREPGIPGTAIEVRKFIMTVDGEEEEKPIEHYLYPNWPDFGSLAEENVASILALMDITRKANGKGQNARLVHCSAGVGRTGTFIALEFLIGELQGGAWEGWDDEKHSSPDPVFDTVNQLREQRKTMVQAYEQYTFLYEVLRKMWEEKYDAKCVGGEHEHVTGNTDGGEPPVKVVKTTNVCDVPLQVGGGCG